MKIHELPDIENLDGMVRIGIEQEDFNKALHLIGRMVKGPLWKLIREIARGERNPLRALDPASTKVEREEDGMFKHVSGRQEDGSVLTLDLPHWLLLVMTVDSARDAGACRNAKNDEELLESAVKWIAEMSGRDTKGFYIQEQGTV